MTTSRNPLNIPANVTLQDLRGVRDAVRRTLRATFTKRHGNGLHVRELVREAVLRCRQLDGMIELREDAAQVRRNRAHQTPAAGSMIDAGPTRYTRNR